MMRRLFIAASVLSLLLCAILCAMSVEVHHPITVGGLLVFPIACSIAWGSLTYQQRRLVRRRVAAGRCIDCGYDLRASTDRCPECGRPIPA